MPEKNIFNIDAAGLIKRIEAIPAIKLQMLDSLLLEVANTFYDAYEYVLELPGKINLIKKEEVNTLLTDLQSLNQKATSIMDILCESGYRSKNMSRATEVLGRIEDDIPGLVKEIQEIL